MVVILVTDIIETLKGWATAEPGLAIIIFCSFLYLIYAFATAKRGRAGAPLDPWTLFFTISSGVFFIIAIILAFKLEVTAVALLVAFVVIGIMFLLIQFELLRKFVFWVIAGVGALLFGKRRKK